MDQHRRRTYAYVKQDRFVLENCESSTGWTGSADVTAVTTSTNHKEGTNSLSFAKSLGTVVAGSITKTISPTLNLVDYYDGHLRYWVYLSSLTDVTSISLTIGQSASHNNVYTVLKAALSAGWNMVDVEVDSPTTVTGNGVTWTSVSYMSFTVTLDGAAKTLAGILLDTVSVLYRIDANIESISLSGTGLATAALQTTGNTSLGTIKTNTDPLVTAGAGGYVRQDSTATIAKETGGNLADVKTSVQIMDDWDESDRAKVNMIAGQAGILGGSTTVAAPAANIANSLPWSVYKTSPATRTDGQGGPLLSNPAGDLNTNLNTQLSSSQDSVAVKGQLPTNNKNTALAASLVANAAACTAVEVRWTNTKSTVQYGQVHNTATLPADTAVPFALFTMPANSSGSWTPTSEGVLSTGFVVCNSSTAATKTIGAADCWFECDYR